MPAGFVFNTPPGPGLNASLIDLGNRFRLLVNEVDVVSPEQPMPKLPFAQALFWKSEVIAATGLYAPDASTDLALTR